MTLHKGRKSKAKKVTRKKVMDCLEMFFFANSARKTKNHFWSKGNFVCEKKGAVAGEPKENLSKENCGQGTGKKVVEKKNPNALFYCFNGGFLPVREMAFFLVLKLLARARLVRKVLIF